jgi:hypothetical protein
MNFEIRAQTSHWVTCCHSAAAAVVAPSRTLDQLIDIRCLSVRIGGRTLPYARTVLGQTVHDDDAVCVAHADLVNFLRLRVKLQIKEHQLRRQSVTSTNGVEETQDLLHLRAGLPLDGNGAVQSTLELDEFLRTLESHSRLPGVEVRLAKLRTMKQGLYASVV